MDLRIIKKELRNKITGLRNSLSAEELEAKSRAVTANFFSIPELRDAGGVFIFVSFRSEVKTEPIINELFKRGKKVIVPFSDVKNRKLLLFFIESLDELKKGAYGIMEPDPATAREASLENVDFAVIPGSVFDQKGGRMGYGGGFYDRLMPKLKKGVPKVALAFELQIVDEVPRGYYDKKVGIIVTEERILRAPRDDR
jgi:5-formyltetrahydrofolate cyclo-ligase